MRAKLNNPPARANSTDSILAMLRLRTSRLATVTSLICSIWFSILVPLGVNALDNEADAQFAKDLYSSICSQVSFAPTDSDGTNDEPRNQNCCIFCYVSGTTPPKGIITAAYEPVTLTHKTTITKHDHFVRKTAERFGRPAPRAPPILST
jgi:hypothetical protein